MGPCRISMRTRLLLISLLCWSLLSAGDYTADSRLLGAYLRGEMSVWQALVDSAAHSPTPHTLSYEYGYCGFLVDCDKEAARPYVRLFRQHTETLRGELPAGHYAMYMSAVCVYELRLHLSFHPVRALNLAREAVRLAPEDPLTLIYCATALFYAPQPFGNKDEALTLFEKAERLTRGKAWHNCWWRPNAMMYIAQCYDKQGRPAEAAAYCHSLLREYPDYLYIRNTYLPSLNERQ